jgi:hypothetical protein
MTLILTKASKHFIIQVTDRLVSRGVGRGNPVAFDPIANKNVVFAARNAVVTMGFTGVAFIGDLPTDQWIVEKLTGIEFSRTEKPPMMFSGKLPHWWDIGKSLLTLKDALSHARAEVQSQWRQQWTKLPFDISIAGWQWDTKGMSRPIVAWLSKPSGEDTVKLNYKERNWYYDQQQGSSPFIVFSAPESNFKMKELQVLGADLQNKRVDDAEQIMLAAIRQVSRRNRMVGPHCMSIVMLPPSNGYLRIRYIPDGGPAIMRLSTQNKTLHLPAAFTPWLVGQGGYMAPSIISGKGFTTGLGPYTVYLDAPDSGDNLKGAIGSHERPGLGSRPRRI